MARSVLLLALAAIVASHALAATQSASIPSSVVEATIEKIIAAHGSAQEPRARQGVLRKDSAGEARTTGESRP